MKPKLLETKRRQNPKIRKPKDHETKKIMKQED